MKLSPRTIERVRQIPVTDVLSHITPLKRTGKRYKCLSPFTAEKSPSFVINPDKNVWFCFSCGKSGDVIKFVMEYEKLSFHDAVKFLADKFAITIKYES